MSATDDPLKVLITNAKEAFASWLLGRPVTDVQPLNVEFPSRGVRSDLLFIVEDEPRTILHLELQGASSRRPMPLRQLEYLNRIVEREVGVPTRTTPLLHSVVIYIGKGAGATDSGKYEVLGLGKIATISWQYDVIRLWQKTPQWLANLRQPALLALAGQTNLTNPEQELPATLAQIREVEDTTLRHQLIGSFASLLPSKEIIEMMEAYLESDEQWVLELPYLKMLREKATAIGREVGFEQGLSHGLSHGRAQGASAAMRKAILTGAARQFTLSIAQFQALENKLEKISDVEQLEAILADQFGMTHFEQLTARVEIALA